MNKEIEKLQEIIDDSENIVFFGGAGVSTESNIPDFRSADGLYQQKYKYSPEQIVSHTFFMRNTEGFYEFYKEKMMFLDAKPNAAHKKLAELEQAGKLKAIITQNIDGLHQAAGSKNVYEIHGSIHRNYCQKCGKFYDAAYVKNSKTQSASAVLVMAVYDADGRCVAIKTAGGEIDAKEDKTLTTEGYTLPANVKGYSVRIMTVDGLDTIMPLVTSRVY